MCFLYVYQRVNHHAMHIPGVLMGNVPLHTHVWCRALARVQWIFQMHLACNMLV